MGLKKNILYSSFLTTSLYIFQFITYPYVARVLGVTNIGICNFAQSIVQYFTLFSMLGISALGVREIAKNKGDRRKLNETFSQLFSLNAIFTLSVLAIYVLSIEIVPQFAPYKKLLYIGGIQLFFNLFVVEWLFRGLENFKYITVRTMLIRIAYVASVFLLVRSSDDYVVYYTISVGMIVANGVVNWIYAKKYVKLFFQPLLKLTHFLKPIFYLGAQILLTSVYTTFNVVYLGMMCGDTQVGYYTTATKIENIILALYSSFTMVMMPRMSSLLASNDKKSANAMLQKSMELLFAFVFPCIIFAEFYAEHIVYLVAGAEFEGAVLPMQIVTPAMLIVGMEQILIVQFLMPGQNDREVFINSVIGAVCSLILNVLFVSKLQSIGSSIVWLVCELVVLGSALYFAKKKYSYFVFPKQIYAHILYFAPLTVVMHFMSIQNLTFWSAFIVGFALTIVYSHFVLKYGIKNQVYIEIMSIIKKELKTGSAPNKTNRYN